MGSHLAEWGFDQVVAANCQKNKQVNQQTDKGQTKKPTNKNKLISKLSWEGFRLNCCNKPCGFRKVELKKKREKWGKEMQFWK